jgi:hypothetical protein
MAHLDDVKANTQAKQASTVDEKDKVEQGTLLVREMAMRTMKRRHDDDGHDPKKKQATDNRRNSLAAAIDTESERVLVAKEKELDFERFKLETETKQRELDREERKAGREHQVVLARIESEKMLSMFQALARNK